jgi:hypothetical protein
MLPALVVQVTAVFAEFKTAAANCCVADGAIVTPDGETVTVTAGGGGVCTVTVAVPLEDGAAALVARTVTVAGLGTAAGAVYNPVEEMDPAVAVHVTAVLLEPETVALNCRVALAETIAVAGATVTVTGAAPVTLKLTELLVVPPSPLLVTPMGTFEPTCAAVAMPVAFNPVDETRVVASGVLPKLTTELAPKLAPLREIVNCPTDTDDGDVLQSCTAGWVTVIVTVPNLVTSAVLVA